MPHPAVLAGCVIAGAATFVALEVAIFRPWREEHGEEFVANAQNHWGNFRREWASAFDEMNPMAKRRGGVDEDSLREIEAFEMERRLREEEDRHSRQNDRLDQTASEGQDMKKRYEAEMSAGSEVTGLSSQVDHHSDGALIRRRRASGHAGRDSLLSSNHTIGEISPVIDRHPAVARPETGFFSIATDLEGDGREPPAPLSPSLHTYQATNSHRSASEEERNYLEDELDGTLSLTSLHSSSSMSPRMLSGRSSPFEEHLTSPGSRSRSSSGRWQHTTINGSIFEEQGSDIFTDVAQTAGEGGQNASALTLPSLSSTYTRWEEALSPSSESQFAWTDGGRSDEWERLSEERSTGSEGGSEHREELQRRE
ncbi:hypothetical protein BCV69DRAFT_285049 [Microstroma glucosiphilum]|uniref:Uncharacterized protein n=1 Tax=Pseudomicrostroma glucosiphilum TaxID=1684307 RepID=A0A316U1W7_9BASI|nr:hypothetical protein BCV69DRAFT_285049 [Pseudomicrostroma glucosiphilum]PWN18423.1 hypothetical protein BCV69DRAFT_285049 [Pseudomicrostroma glucosiphilum]